MDQADAGIDPNRSAEAPPDVFLSYNSADRKAVEEIAEALRRAGLKVWFDVWCLDPGDTWQTGLELGLGRAASCAVFLGAHGPGRWQKQEISLALNRQVTEDGRFRLVPVLLPGAVDDRPDFLDVYQWVTFPATDDPEALRRLLRGLRGGEPGERTAPAPRGECPYRPLKVFAVGDAPYFFGRAAEIEELLGRLRPPPGGGRFVAILGSSGSGKSSLAQAGVLAGLRSGALAGSAAWPPPVILRPQSDPLRRLALGLAPRFGYRDADVDYLAGKMAKEPAALRHAIDRGLVEAPPEHRIALLVDQLEEVFTLCQDAEERSAFLATLCDAGLHPESRALVLVTLRSDFYGRCEDFPELRRALDGHCWLGALGRDQLWDAVAEPARRSGWEVQESLLQLLWDDFRRQPPGCLPLLQYALWDMWNRAREPHLTVDLYLGGGGIEGALDRRANEVHGQFSPDEQEICRRVFLRLTEPREEKDFRLRLPLEHLLPPEGDPAPVAGVLETLTRERLLTRDEAEGGGSVVEIAHEALLTSWKILRDWLETRRDQGRTHARLSAAAREWERRGSSPDDLLVGGHLIDAESWAEQHREDLNRLEEDFLRASVAARRRRQAWKMGAVAAIGLLAVVAFLLAYNFRRRGELAFVRELGLRAEQVVEADPQRGLLLALESLRRVSGEERSPEAETALHAGLATSGGTWIGAWDESVKAAAFRGQEIVLVSRRQDRTDFLSRWSFEGKRLGEPVPLPGEAAGDLRFSPDGGWLVSWREGQDLRLTRVGPPLSSVRIAGTRDPMEFWFSPDSRWLAVQDLDENIRIRNVRDLSLPALACPSPETEATGACSPLLDTAPAFSAPWLPEAGVRRVDPSGRWLVAWDATGPARLWDLRLPEPGAGEDPLRFGPERRALFQVGLGWRVLADPSGEARFWNLQANPPQASQALRCTAVSRWEYFILGADRRWLAGGDAAGACIWNLGGGAPLRAPAGLATIPPQFLELGPEGLWLATLGAQESAQLWKRHPSGTYREVPLPRTGSLPVASVSFGPRADRPLAFLRSAGTTEVWDLAPSPPKRLESLPATSLFRLSPGGRWGVTGVHLGRLGLMDLDHLGHAGEEMILIQAGEDPQVAFSADDRWLAIGDRAGKITLWSLPEGMRQLERYVPGPVHAIALHRGAGSPKMAAGSSEKVAYLWDLAQDASLSAVQLRWKAPPQDPRDQPLSDDLTPSYMAFSPDGERLLVQSAWHAWVWRLDLPGLEKLACEKLGRNLSRLEWLESTGRNEAPPETCPGLPHPPF